MSLFRVEGTGKDVLVKGGVELIIPVSLTKDIVSILHETHLSAASMKKQARGKFWWASINADLEEKYKNCNACAINAISKVQKTVEITPVALDKLAPNEILSLDFGAVGDLQILFLKDRYSGFNPYN